MKISITREEFTKFRDYEYALRNYPCRKCKSNTGSCTGCREEIAWKDRTSQIGVKADEYTGVIAECMKAYWDSNEMQFEVLSLKEKADQCTAEYQRLKAMIEIEEEVDENSVVL